jgi:hypothetical protein
LAVQIDGLTIGSARLPLTRIRGVTSGLRKLALEHPQYLPFTAIVRVKRGETVRIVPDLKLRPSDASALRSGVFWGGAGLTAAGGAIVLAALLRSHGDVQAYCFTQSALSCPPSRQFQTLGYVPGAAPTFDNRSNPPGILLLPLGYSLVGTGLVWSLGTRWFGDDSEVPWVQLVAGVAAGALSYGLSASLNGPSPFDRSAK